MFHSKFSYVRNIKNRLFLLTPIGRSDVELRDHLEGKDFEDERLDEYDWALSKYRTHKFLHYIIKILFYAGIITSITATIGLEVRILTQVASYIGVTLLFILFTATLYFSELYREEFHVKREILISNAE
jgi:hypothetical protein